MTVADDKDRDIAIAASVSDTANTPRTAGLLGRKVSRSTGGRWLFDDGSEAFRDLGLPVPDTFFDVRPRQGVSSTPADSDRLVAIMKDIITLLKPTAVRANGALFSDWSDRGRLCFAWASTSRAANVEGLDFDATTYTEGASCSTAAVRRAAAPSSLRRGRRQPTAFRSGSTGQDCTPSTPKASLFVSHLPDQQVARTLAAKVREFAGIAATYRETAR